MIRNLKDLKDYRIGAADGPIGRVVDLYVDDATWVVRYVVVETGAWLASRKILLAPLSIKALDASNKVLTVSLSKLQVALSPEIDVDQPVSRQHETRLSSYYRYPRYWENNGPAGQGAYPPVVTSSLSYRGTGEDSRAEGQELARVAAREDFKRHAHDDAHLRSSVQMLNCAVQATDGEIGRVRDVLVDDAVWSVSYLLVDTGHWWKGHPVLLDPQWILPWRGETPSLSVNRTRAFLQDAPRHPASDMPALP